MTTAVCIACGEMKHGAFNRCQSCGMIPNTALEFAMSVHYTDHYHSASDLIAISKAIKENVAAINLGVGSFVFDNSIIPVLEGFLADPSSRDPLTLRRQTRSSWLIKQLNAHLIGPDGYESSVVKRGKDIGKNEFDAVSSIGDGDLYLICAYEGGHRRTSAISKSNWYALRDLMVLKERAPQNKYLQLLDNLCENFLSNYVRFGQITQPEVQDS